MAVGDRIRNCDLFGLPIGLRLDGQASYRTVAGGFVSILVKLLICAYFLLQLTAVLSYGDPQISSFKVFESRREMHEPINLSEYGMGIFFAMTNEKKTPIVMDRRIGRFKLTSVKWGYRGNDFKKLEEIEIELHEIDFVKERNLISHFDGQPV